MSIAKPFTFIPGKPAESAKVNKDFDILYSQVNTNIADIAQNALDIQSVGNDKANVNGDSTKRFAVANPTVGTDAVNKQSLLDLLYPINSVYLSTSTASTCPIQTLLGGTWSKIEGRYLLASGRINGGSSTETYTAGSTVAAGLPNVSGTIISNYEDVSGAFTKGTDKFWGGGRSDAVQNGTKNFKASSSNSIYGQSNTVRPPAYVFSVWRRTA